jgi:hypothetical protein
MNWLAFLIYLALAPVAVAAGYAIGWYGCVFLFGPPEGPPRRWGRRIK